MANPNRQEGTVAKDAVYSEKFKRDTEPNTSKLIYQMMCSILTAV